MAARSSRSEELEFLPEDLRIALHQLALDVLDLGRVRMQSRLLLEVTVQQYSLPLQQALLPLLQIDLTPVNEPRLPWLLALTGDQARFERLDLEPFGNIDSQYYFREGLERVVVPWRHGTQNLIENFFRLATLPVFNLAVRFVWPRYYDGPLYHGLRWAVTNDNAPLLRLALVDYHSNMDLLEQDANADDWYDEEGPELEPEYRQGYYFDALQLAISNSKWELVEIFIEYNHNLKPWRHVRKVPPAMAELLLRRRPSLLLDLLAESSYSNSVARRIVEGLTQAIINANAEMANRAVVKLVQANFLELAVELAARIPELRLEVPHDFRPLTFADLEMRRQQYLAAAGKAMEMGQPRVAAALERLLSK